MAYNNLEVSAGACALSAATPKTVINVIAPTNIALRIKRIVLAFDGATSTAVPCKIEIFRSTQAGAGTSTALTPAKLDPGRQETVQSTAGGNYSAEPTVLTVQESWVEPVYNGLVIEPKQPDAPVIVPGGTGYGIRCTSPAGVNVYPTIVYEE